MADAAKAAPRFVGQSIKRKENKRFLTGRGHYVDDVILPGMLHAAILRSPLARAAILSIDTSAAKDLPGVYGVFTGDDINPLYTAIPPAFSQTGVGGIDVVLQTKQVCYVGDPVVIIVAEDRYIAEDAAELVEIDYDPLDAVVTIADAKTAAPFLPGKTSNMNGHTPVNLPGADEAFAKAAHITTAFIAQGRVAPTPMETRGIIVDPRMDGQLEIHMTAQGPQQVRRYLAPILRMPENHIRVLAPDVGGAFGQKFSINRDMLATIGAALLLKRPVKWIEDRTEALQGGGHGRTEQLSLSLAMDGDGKILATKFGVEENIGADPGQADGVGGLMMMYHTGAYDVPTFSADLKTWFTNTGGLVPYRGPWAGETLIREITIDKAARELGMDPVELRRRNMIKSFPHKMPLGLVVDDVTPGECLDLLVEKLDVPAFRAEQAKARSEGRLLGLGLAVYLEPTAISAGAMASDSTEIRLEPSGKVVATMTSHSQGQSIETTMAQIIADEMGVDVDDVTINYGDSAAIGFGSGAGGSRQAVVGGGSAKVAAERLRTKVIRTASHFLQTPVDQLRVENSAVVSTNGTGPSMSFADIANASYFQPKTLPDDLEPGLTGSFRYAPDMFTTANGAHGCVVEVDAQTGMVKINRYVVAEDCGVMLNPAVVEGQVSGGVIAAIGNILFEEQHYDEQGNPSAGTFKDYGMPLSQNAPVIEFHHLCTPSKTPTGAKGVGEGGAIIGAPTIYNAIIDALAPLDVKLEQLPLTPARIVAAVKAAGG